MTVYPFIHKDSVLFVWELELEDSVLFVWELVVANIKNHRYYRSNGK